MFDLVDGLPIHVLIVHAVVVFLPLIAAGFIAVVFIPKFRHNIILGLLLTGLAIGTVSAFIAKQSGEQFATHVGLPAKHAELGDWVPALSLAWLVIAVLWVWSIKKDLSKVAQMAFATAVIGLSILVTVLVVLTGHSGVQASWAKKIAPVAAAPVASSAPSPSVSTAPSVSGSAAPSPSATAASYTLADVAKHSTQADCWTAVSGSVYDVTKWIPQHPGGPDVIIAMCGIDGTASFEGVHGGQSNPANVLTGFKIGALAP